jgi:gluconokinase
MPNNWNTAVVGIVVMGVTGAGKSTVGSLLSEKLSRPLIEGDSLHPPANIEKMSRGTPLNDDDRLPWLKAIAARIDAARNAGLPIIVTCSALKRSYREILTDGHDDVGFVYLKGAKDLIAGRLAARKGHFMPPQLLDSQMAALQEPSADEPSMVIAIDAPPDDIVRTIVEGFKTR